MTIDSTPAAPANPPTTPIDPNSALPVAPQEVPTNVTLDPLSGAGVRLTTHVLAILSGVLFLLLIALIAQETRYSEWTTAAYRSALGSLVISPGVNRQPALFGPVLTALRSVENDPAQTQARQLLKAASDQLSRSENIVADKPSVEKLALDMGALAQDAQGRAVDSARLHDIVVRMETLSNASVLPGETLEQLKARQDLLKAYMDASNATREFWVRIAQMILLNLLLPVLTGLLGYVFASRPSGK